MIVVTGTGYSGTGYAAAVLNQLGIRCGHEAVYRLDGNRPRDGWQADSSWMAPPVLDGDETVIHLVRRPVDVINSMWTSERLPKEQARWGADYFPDFDPVRFYVDWNRRCEAVADLRVQVEGIHHPEVPTNVNTKRRGDPFRNIDDLAETFPHGPIEDLREMAWRYGY